MTDIPVKQRDDFSAYLRKHKVIRLHSHEVARVPGRRYFFARCGDGYIRVCGERGLPRLRQRSKFFGGVLEVFVIRWKVDPQPGPNSWEGRRWDNYRKRYVYA